VCFRFIFVLPVIWMTRKRRRATIVQTNNLHIDSEIIDKNTKNGSNDRNKKTTRVRFAVYRYKSFESIYYYFSVHSFIHLVIALVYIMNVFFRKTQPDVKRITIERVLKWISNRMKIDIMSAHDRWKKQSVRVPQRFLRTAALWNRRHRFPVRPVDISRIF